MTGPGLSPKKGSSRCSFERHDEASQWHRLAVAAGAHVVVFPFGTSV